MDEAGECKGRACEYRDEAGEFKGRAYEFKDKACECKSRSYEFNEKTLQTWRGELYEGRACESKRGMLLKSKTCESNGRHANQRAEHVSSSAGRVYPRHETRQ